jgi:hypothetical protein
MLTSCQAISHKTSFRESERTTKPTHTAEIAKKSSLLNIVGSFLWSKPPVQMKLFDMPYSNYDTEYSLPKTPSHTKQKMVRPRAPVAAVNEYVHD